MKSNKNSTLIANSKTIGSFFILAFIAYGFGRHLFESETVSEKYLGAVLIITNSIMVLFIGVLLSKSLQKYNAIVGTIYLYARVIEAVFLASIVLNLIRSIRVSHDSGYFFAMLVLGIGSVPMCYTLFKQRLLPSWLAICGIAGYAVFAFGFLMELFGNEWSMYLLPPAGLWEITFAIWLIIKGARNNKTTNQ